MHDAYSNNFTMNKSYHKRHHVRLTVYYRVKTKSYLISYESEIYQIVSQICEERKVTEFVTCAKNDFFR